jgi:hypothetical protein
MAKGPPTLVLSATVTVPLTGTYFNTMADRTRAAIVS